MNNTTTMNNLSILYPINDENCNVDTTPLKSLKNSPKHQNQQFQRPSPSRSITTSNRHYSHSSRPATKRATTARSRANSIKAIGPRIQKSATVVLIGDSNCGKTSLVLTYLNKKFSTAPKSVLFETYDKSINFNNNTIVDLQIWDFPGDEYFDRFRPLAYANAKGVLICFTLDRLESLSHIEERWIPELETHCPNSIKIIVGIGSEVRFDKTKVDKVPPYDYCYKYAKKLGCKYMECSLVDRESYIKVFEQLAILSTTEAKPQQPVGLLMPKTRTNTITNILYLGDNEDQQQQQPKGSEGKSNKRVTSYHKRRSFIGCSIV